MRQPSEIKTAFAARERLSEFTTFFLVGIGGAGMAGVAELLHQRGFTVRGSDSTDSPTIAALRNLGIQVEIGHSGDAIKPGMGLILTDAIDLQTSPEVARGRELNLPLFRRSQALGWLLGDRRVIAVTGTHGKTTTTGMVGAGLRAGGLDPLIVVGADVPEFGGAVVFGRGDWAVVEACEAYDSFHDIDPEIAILTNLEADHLDFHGTEANLKDSVGRFLSKARMGVVYCDEDEGARTMALNLAGMVVPYDASTFVGEEPLASPGAHNRLNAGAALLAARMAGADETKATKGIAAFRGAARRLQVLRESGPTIIDDYAHHPTEIVASIQALRDRYPGRRLVIVFQPHLYSRTAEFLNEFASALSLADFVLITDIYRAREEPIPGISSARIAEMLTVPHKYVPSRHVLPREVTRILQPDDVVVGMGAGTITEFTHRFAESFDRPGPTRVWVCYGGDSAEREVSLHSGAKVADALESRGYAVTLLDLSECLLNPGLNLPTERPDVAFLAVHGTHAEDGAIQGLFELLHVPYTGSGVQSSALAMDKNLAKQILSQAGIRVPQGYKVDRVEDTVELPGVTRYVVKPNTQGSTVGLSFVESPADLKSAVQKALSYSAEALVEEWITGVEISVPVLIDTVLPAVEIRPRSGQYDFANKYIPGATEEICPARLSPEMTARAADYALRAHAALGCAGATRTDMFVTEDDLVVLEVNTLPGMTPTSLLPLSASVAGINFESLCERIVRDAMERDGS
ncbi:MAG: D-alanine--D-alanine ligase [Chthonomonas sp.]|nr:D-alanine--D-alanine ligase [Chthonomonas sp.]